MNYRMMAHLLSRTMRVVALFMLPALIISIANGEERSAWSFAIVMALMFGLSIPFGKKPRNISLFARDGFVLAALVWIVISVLGALPFYISGSIPNFVDCLFETISGFTTTGASILADVESLPMGILYWRSFTHWLGGMGVLVFLLAISTFSSDRGDTIFIMRAESPGPQVSKLVPRTRQTARLLYEIYIGLTILQVVLMLLGGMPAFDSLLIAFGTAGTGGFAIRNDSMMSYSPYIQWVVTIFMAMFGVNFGVYYVILMRQFRSAAKDEEFRVYVLILLISTAIITSFILPIYGNDFGESIRHAAFQVASIMTTTGFATTDYEIWPQFCHAFLMLLMIIGASAGSTGGGIKCSRVLILWRSLKGEMQKMLHPNVVKPVKMDGKTIPSQIVSGVHAYMAAYGIIAICSVLLVSLDGESFETNVSSVLACLNNIGPGFNVTGATGNYSGFSPAVKLVLSADMLIGRLEIFPIVFMFMPGVWTRGRY